MTHFVAGLGTSGTFVGVGRRLREHIPGMVLASMQPDSPLHGLEGLKHMETAIVPGIYDARLADVDVRVDTEEAVRDDAAAGAGGRAAGRDFERRERRRRASRSRGQGAVVVMVFCDGGERYLSERFWENPRKAC